MDSAEEHGQNDTLSVWNTIQVAQKSSKYLNLELRVISKSFYTQQNYCLDSDKLKHQSVTWVNAEEDGQGDP